MNIKEKREEEAEFCIDAVAFDPWLKLRLRTTP